ncbi:MAG: malectin domain-containing carbohydrate-binding protein, partial [Planctomycetota bacterium]
LDGREKWAIPWLEDDMALASPQLWVGRTRKDAADALAYRCTGLMGLQWRTRILGPNMLALARAGWDQSPWNPTPGEVPPSVLPDRPGIEGPLGGNVADYPGREIAGTDDEPLYQTCRYNLDGYNLKVPNGRCRVTLKFCEPHFNAAGKRIGDMKLQGKTALEKLDIFAEVGQFAALDYTFDDVEVTDGWLRLGIVARESLPCISAIAVEGAGFHKKINCGGPAYRDYAADGPQTTPITMGPPRGLPVEDFYADWTLAMFGPEAAEETAALFSRIDGRLPRAGASACPCGLAPDPRPWKQVAQEYAFVDELARCRATVHGPGNLSRFDYWLGTLAYLRAKGRLQCAWGDVNAALRQLEQEKDSTRRKQLAAEIGLPKYRELLHAFAEAYRHLLETTHTYGAMATVISWEHNPRYRLNALEETGRQLAEALGSPLPEDARPTRQYEGPLRVIVPTIRTIVTRGEPLNLKAIVLSANPPDDVRLHWRPLGPGPFTEVHARHVARGVYRFSLAPNEMKTDIEYYIEARAAGAIATFPATAPALNQTVVVTGLER